MATSTGRRADEVTRRCSGWTKTGDACKAYAIRGTEKCITHSLTPAQLHERMQRAGKASQLKRRTKSEIAELRPMSSFRDGVSLQEVIDVCRPALTATFTHDDSPDWGARLLACLVLLHAFPRALRANSEDVRRMLAEVLPSTHAELAEREALDFYVNARREWIAGQVNYSPILGLFVRAFPPFCIAPWESAASVRSELPKLDEWKVTDIDSPTHVLAAKPNGSRELVPRDNFAMQRDAA
jgi:hypothetical protein